MPPLSRFSFQIRIWTNVWRSVSLRLSQCLFFSGKSYCETQRNFRQRAAGPHRHVSHFAAWRPVPNPKPDQFVRIRPHHSFHPGDQSDNSSNPHVTVWKKNCRLLSRSFCASSSYGYLQDRWICFKNPGTRILPRIQSSLETEHRNMNSGFWMLVEIFSIWTLGI